MAGQVLLEPQFVQAQVAQLKSLAHQIQAIATKIRATTDAFAGTGLKGQAALALQTRVADVSHSVNSYTNVMEEKYNVIAANAMQQEESAQRNAAKLNALSFPGAVG